MRHALTVNRFLFFIFCSFCINVFAAEFSYIDKDDNFNKITVHDNGGIKYIYAINPETSQAFLFKEDGSDFIYVGDDIDYTMDGVYFIAKVKRENEKLLSVMTIFNGAGGQVKKYFVEISNGLPYVSGVVTFNFNYNQNPDLQQRCVQADTNDTEICLVESRYKTKTIYSNIMFSGKGLIKSKQTLYKDPETTALSKGYLIKDDKVVIFDEKISSDNKKWCHIGYKGKKEVVAWIPCSSIRHIN